MTSGYKEFASLINNTEIIKQVLKNIEEEAAQAFRQIAREYERTKQPVPDHYLSTGGYLGEMIVRALIIVGLIAERSVDRYVVKAYVPTEQGVALYKKLVEEGAFPQRASAAPATGGPSSQKAG
ncbi:MAG: hypothetical protein HY685_02580 [Chloroflexi bacterium]|nr:hypothetical protein [Chloroflexota bacterium]